MINVTAAIQIVRNLSKTPFVHHTKPWRTLFKSLAIWRWPSPGTIWPPVYKTKARDVWSWLGPYMDWWNGSTSQNVFQHLKSRLYPPFALSKLVCVRSQFIVFWLMCPNNNNIHVPNYRQAARFLSGNWVHEVLRPKTGVYLCVCVCSTAYRAKMLMVLNICNSGGKLEFLLSPFICEIVFGIAAWTKGAGYFYFHCATRTVIKYWERALLY